MNSWIPIAGVFTSSQLAIFVCLNFLFISGCSSPGIGPPTLEPGSTRTATVSITPTLPSTPTSALPVLLPSPSSAHEDKPLLDICSPLEGVPLDQLAEHISNPFYPPPPGSDDPHQGIDLADIGVEGIALEGLQVNSVLAGQIAGVIQQRFPYGNALLVETRLDRLPADWLSRLPLTELIATPQVRSSLTCPEPRSEADWDSEAVSLYLLYAHLQSPPAYELEDEIGCGQMVGVIGSSGNALNPHLHLELRAGPAGARFASLAHYDPSASIDEMAAYCTWRVSGVFGLLDPSILFSLP
jgi:murein DD-endopeptidase MepM/ murein hydrolase activator NlpD